MGLVEETGISRKRNRPNREVNGRTVIECRVSPKLALSLAWDSRFVPAEWDEDFGDGDVEAES